MARNNVFGSPELLQLSEALKDNRQILGGGRGLSRQQEGPELQDPRPCPGDRNHSLGAGEELVVQNGFRLLSSSSYSSFLDSTSFCLLS